MLQSRTLGWPFGGSLVTESRESRRMPPRRRQVAAVKAELEAAVAAQRQQAQLGAAAAALEARTPSARCISQTEHPSRPSGRIRATLRKYRKRPASHLFEARLKSKA